MTYMGISSLTFQLEVYYVEQALAGPACCLYELFEAYRIQDRSLVAWLVYCLARASNLDLPPPRPGQLMNGVWVTHKFTPSNLLSLLVA